MNGTLATIWSFRKKWLCVWCAVLKKLLFQELFHKWLRPDQKMIILHSCSLITHYSSYKSQTKHDTDMKITLMIFFHQVTEDWKKLMAAWPGKPSYWLFPMLIATNAMIFMVSIANVGGGTVDNLVAQVLWPSSVQFMSCISYSESQVNTNAV